MSLIRRAAPLAVFTLAVLVAVLAGAAFAAWAQDFCSVPPYPKQQSRFVVDDDNNLRTWGGAGYAKAPILDKLNKGEMVRLISQDGGWAEVVTRRGQRGFVNAKCLTAYDAFVTGKSPAGNVDSLIGCTKGTAVAPLRVDLDGDGKLETLRLTCAPGNGCVDYFLDVLAPDGRVLFAGPREGPSLLIFCSCHAGVYLPEVFFDMDGDGRKEMILLHPRSDVSPTAVEAFRFNGSGFDHVLTNKAYFAAKENPDLLRAVDYREDGPEPYRYLYGLKTDKSGELIASIAGDGASGEAVVRFTPEGLKVIRWTMPYKKWS